ncbi:MAG: bifunctional riboflavin kinase/FAD synthetase [Gemmataceae bacterium]|nr:bifunctional riboflavin kinase/FAD synthetase [Gemmataceae bacterium]MCI0741153.1 bifunctional riboflavin kinase/FAD synthetase [Gemmataceae bacterium]
MSFFRLSLDDAVPQVCSGGVVTLGNFDGVHLGHQALLAEAVRLARKRGGPAVAVTFDPHPQQLLRPQTFQPILTTLNYRSSLIHAYGVDHVLVFGISPRFLKLTAREFFERVICQKLAARGIVEGFNFGFGHGREGNTALLQAWGEQAGIQVILMPALERGGRPISTSRVRAELEAGRVAGANSLLARPYRLTGSVGVGQKRGQTLGFPTANLHELETLIPGNGVYAGCAWVRGAEVPVCQAGKNACPTAWSAAVNIGPNPTFGENARKVEVHLIGFQGDLYGQSLSVDFLERIRDIRTFSGPAELIEQLKIDVQRAKEIHRLAFESTDSTLER